MGLEYENAKDAGQELGAHQRFSLTKKWGPTSDGSKSVTGEIAHPCFGTHTSHHPNPQIIGLGFSQIKSNYVVCKD